MEFVHMDKLEQKMEKNGHLGVLNSPIYLLGLLLCLFVGVGTSYSQEQTQRLVTFRDGSVLLADVLTRNWIFSNDGGDTWDQILAEDLHEITWAPMLPDERLKRMWELRLALGAEAYSDRVKASTDLQEAGEGFRAVLAEWARTEEDPEIRIRLEKIVEALPVDQVMGPKARFDCWRQKDGEMGFGRWVETPDSIFWKGQEIPVDRETVWKLTEWQGGPVRSRTDLPLGSIRSDDDDRIPKQVRWLDFDKGPQGQALKEGDRAGDLFAEYGVRFSSSLKGSYFGIDAYRVRGKSGGLSASPQQPRWQGDTIIDFHVPGRPDLSATVHRVGFWIAAVMPKGTALKAYGVDGEEIETYETMAGPNEFIGIQSPEPIAQVRVVPNKFVDSNYVIDDLFFDEPVAVLPASEEGFATIRLANGEQVLATTLEWEAGEDWLRCGELSVGIKKVLLPMEEVVEIVFAEDVAAPLPLVIPFDEVEEGDDRVDRVRIEVFDPRMEPANQVLLLRRESLDGLMVGGVGDGFPGVGLAIRVEAGPSILTSVRRLEFLAGGDASEP